MVCKPSDNNLSPVNLGPPPVIPGFGLPFVSGIPIPDVSIPDGIPEDLLALIRKILANIPGGRLLPQIDEFTKTILDALASVLNQLAPYLALYNFFQALLNMIACILDVLCSLMNPWSLIRALNRLFKRCLPDFLNLFPWLALIAMIIALLLLLLALIDYLIATILALIRDIIENLELLAKVIQVKGTDADILSAARKIAQLFCLIEQLFAVLIAFQAIMAIIEALAKLAGRGVCDSGGDSGCCSDDVCPPFIRQNPDGITSKTGELVYHKQIDNALTGPLVGLVLPAARKETWQFLDNIHQQYNIKDIITPIEGNIFWPEGRSYKADSSVKKVPYLIDMTMIIDPSVFGQGGGNRTVFIKDAVVIEKPYIGLVLYDGSVDTGTNDVLNGTVYIEGGLVFEADKTTPVMVDGKQATLNTFIHEPAGIGVPTSEDGYFISSIEYTLKPNHPALVEQNIINIGCVPEISTEIGVINAIIAPSLAPVLSRIGGSLPNTAGTVACLSASLNQTRQNVSPQNVALMQAQMVACLNSLKAGTVAAYNATIAAGASQFNTTITLTPPIQFVTSPILVAVTLKDANGTILTERMPDASQKEIASLITADITFGQISEFVYDGYQDFVAKLTSKDAGTGQITVSFDGNVISVITGRNDATVPTAIESNVQSYTFIGAGTFGGISGDPEPVPRRDESDVGGG